VEQRATAAEETPSDQFIINSEVETNNLYPFLHSESRHTLEFQDTTDHVDGTPSSVPLSTTPPVHSTAENIHSASLDKTSDITGEGGELERALEDKVTGGSVS